MKQGAYIERYAEMVDFLVKAPRTIAEISVEIDLTEQSARRWLMALHALGRLKKIPGRVTQPSGPGKAPMLFVWQP